MLLCYYVNAHKHCILGNTVTFYFYGIVWIIIIYVYIGLNITNSPQNITVCINDMAEINCGFTGVDPILIVPNWIIIMRSDNGSIVSNETVFGGEISANRISGFSWEPDVDSGTDNAPNSILLFGPIKKTHNQSSFQCFFINSRNQIVGTSRIGTITVIGKMKIPAVKQKW